MREVRAKAVKAMLDCVGDDALPILKIKWELQDGSGALRESGHFLTDGNGKSEKTPMDWAWETVHNAGYNGHDITELDGCDCAKVLPTIVMLVLEDDPRNPKYERVKYVNRLGSSNLVVKNSPKGRVLDELRKNFKLAALRGAAEKKSRKPGSEPEPEPEFDDDDFDTD